MYIDSPAPFFKRTHPLDPQRAKILMAEIESIVELSDRRGTVAAGRAMFSREYFDTLARSSLPGPAHRREQ